MPKLKKPVTSYRLIVSRDRLEFRQPLFVIFSGILFLVFGVFSISLSIINPDKTHWIGMFIVFILGLIFTFKGIKMLASINTLFAVFDKHKGVYRLAAQTPDAGTEVQTPSYWSKIGDIKSIELIPRSYWGAGGDSSGGSYTVIAVELVLNNGSRKKILNYGDRQIALDDAKTLSAFVNKPLCDLMDIRPIDSTWGERDPFGRQ